MAGGRKERGCGVNASFPLFAALRSIVASATRRGVDGRDEPGHDSHFHSSYDRPGNTAERVEKAQFAPDAGGGGLAAQAALEKTGIWSKFM
jgi:hypothetical protein